MVSSTSTGGTIMVRSPKDRPPNKNKAPPKPSAFDSPTAPNHGADNLKQIVGEKTMPGATKVNFASVSTSFEPRAAGNVDATLISHEINAASASSGNPTIKLVFGENDSNKQIFKTYSLQPKALWSLKRDLIRLGASIEDMNSEEADLEDIVLALYGYTCTIKFGDPRPYKDKVTGEDKLGDNFLEIQNPSKVN